MFAQSKFSSNSKEISTHWFGKRDKVQNGKKKEQKQKRWPRMGKIGIENNKKIEQSWYNFPKLPHRHSM